MCWTVVVKSNISCQESRRLLTKDFCLFYGCFHQDNQLKEAIDNPDHVSVIDSHNSLYILLSSLSHITVCTENIVIDAATTVYGAVRKMGDAGIVPSKIQKFPARFHLACYFSVENQCNSYEIVRYSSPHGYLHLAFPLS